MTFPDRRKEYALRGLDEGDLAPDPITQFQAWFAEALAAGGPEPHAMTLATATPDGRPSARMVLLRGVGAGGFTFYTNYDGRKAGELAANPWVALVFYWPELERQIRIEGSVARVPAAESDAYYAGRPLESRLGAWASPQSRVIANRAALEARVAAVHAQFADHDPPRPPHWGGYRVTPHQLEFWQGRPARLHDRLRYEREGGGWVIRRLAP